MKYGNDHILGYYHSPLYISLRYNVHMLLSICHQVVAQNVCDNVNRSVSIVKDTVKLCECTYTSNVFSIHLQNGNLKTVWRAVRRQVCVCVCVCMGWMPMEYILLLEDGLFLVNHLALGCATLQLVAGKEVSLTITSK